MWGIIHGGSVKVISLALSTRCNASNLQEALKFREESFVPQGSRQRCSCWPKSWAAAAHRRQHVRPTADAESEHTTVQLAMYAMAERKKSDRRGKKNNRTVCPAPGRVRSW